MAIPTPSHLRVLVKALNQGLPRPVHPKAVLTAVGAFNRWGTSIAGAYALGAKLRPTDVALIDDWGMLSFEDVHRRTNAIAHNFHDLGVSSEDSMGVICKNGRAFVELSIASDKVGCGRVPINTTLAAPQLNAVVKDQSLRVLAYDAEFAPLVYEATDGIQDLVRIAAARNGDKDIYGDLLYSAIVEDSRREDPDPPDHASKTVILTSGTTGPPKGALRSKPGTVLQLLNFLQAIPRRSSSVCHIAAPLYHLHGHAQFEISSAIGSSLILTSRFDPAKTLELVDRYKVNELVVVPIMLRRIVDLPKETLGRYGTESLELVICAGSALDSNLSKSFIDRFGPILYNLYGATELAWGTSASPDDLIKAPGTIGKALPGTRVEVLDDNHCPLGPEEKGRIFVGNDLLFSGYTNRKGDKQIVRGMMSVGDLGHYDCNGYFYVDAREDDMIVSGGENIYPGEVELALTSHPDISEAAVIGVSDDEWGQSLKAFVISRHNSGLNEEGVRTYIKKELAGYKAPRRVVFVDSLPRNAIGKVIKSELV